MKTEIEDALHVLELAAGFASFGGLNGDEIRASIKALKAALSQQDAVNSDLIHDIDLAICESEPADPEKEDSICISHGDFLSVLNSILGDESPRLYPAPPSIATKEPQ